MKKLLVLSLMLCAINVFAKIDKRKAFAKKTDGQEIIIDGVFNELIWKTVTWEKKFTQYRPVENEVPSQKTTFAILYDDNFIYVGIKAYDTDAESIVQRLTRRDDIDGDMVGVHFDTYGDHRTAFIFNVTAGGVKDDVIVSNDGDNADNTWDPIWWVKTKKDANGWYAEMKIPFTQLRFEKSETQEWGFQVMRLLFRSDEEILWQPMSKTINGWVSQYGKLNGIENIEPQKPLSIMPYVVARTDRFEKDADNPFRSKGRDSRFNIGIDGKVGMTNNLMLDFTINPDFGQVEADPSEVNLSTHETFFQEKRPFFIEGKNIFNFPLMFGDGDLGDEGLFYSRRIGRSPHHYPDLDDNEYIDMPDFINIIGAAKMTGKTRSGWSLGIMESMTTEEKAKIKGGEESRKEVVEPFTNYFVGRVQKDFDGANTLLGGMFTAVNRNINEDDLNFLHRSAYSGGVDFSHKWKDKSWEISVNTYFSRVAGDTAAIQNTQKSWIHNFQRPDASHLKYDPSRTELWGHGGKLVLGESAGKFRFMSAVAWKSPGLELNDIGYMRQADIIFQVLWLGYRFYEPFFIFRNAGINFNQWSEWDFGGNKLGPGGNMNSHFQLKNYWRVSFGINYNGEGQSNSMLRGGEGFIVPGSWSSWGSINTNGQKKLQFRVNFNRGRSRVKSYRKNDSYRFRVSYCPIKSLKLSLEPRISTNDSELQYVTQEDYNDGTKYVFGSIARKTISVSFRMNYNITPELSIQYWGQPFVASGEYKDFKYITDSKAEHYIDRFQLYNDNQITYNTTDEVYVIDENNDGTEDYQFDKPDFNVKEFLSNLVVRWEYRPGSTFYLVWSQNRQTSVTDGNFDFNRDMGRLFDAHPHDIFLLKFSYRLGR